MKSQKERIIEMLEQAPNNEITCAELAREFLYHKAASRIGEIERERGGRIEFIRGETVMDGRYRLRKFDEMGQGILIGGGYGKMGRGV